MNATDRILPAMKPLTPPASATQVQAGEDVTIPYSLYSYFGSGGAWGYAAYSGPEPEFIRDEEVDDNGFVRESRGVFRLQPGAVIVYKSGDAVGREGRTFEPKWFVCAV